MMKKYTSLGELLFDYREYHNISQQELADMLNLDVRTIQRWENNQTLIKPDKEEEIVLETLLPYQLIRNLNGAVAIPTFYDLSMRKYSLTPLNNKLPNVLWLKEELTEATGHIQSIEDNSYLEFILRNISRPKDSPQPVKPLLILEAARRLPELNVVITDDSGFYAGHSIVLPVNEEIFEKLKNREIAENEINVSDLVNNRHSENLFFYNYDTTADSNISLYYLTQYYWKFFRKLQQTNYTYGSFNIRNDSHEFNKQLGLKMIWEDEETQQRRGLQNPPRFYVGNFKEYLSE